MTKRWLYGALALLLIAVTAVALGNGREDPTSSRPSASTASTTQRATTTTVPTTVPATVPTTVPTTTTTSAPVPTTTVPALQPGDTGPQVLVVEQRLAALGYFVGAVDGSYDDDTLHGVTAFQKVTGIRRDGLVGPATEAALATAVSPVPRSTDGRQIEVDLARQVMLVVDGGRVHEVLDVSTGKTTGLTPSGHFTIYRQIDGWRHAPLGVLYRPKYFWKGLAIHGYPSVPPVPASHGCIRVTNAEMDWLWASGLADLEATVWIY